MGFEEYRERGNADTSLPSISGAGPRRPSRKDAEAASSARRRRTGRGDHHRGGDVGNKSFNPMDKYKVIKIIGKGSFGNALLVQNKRDECKYVLKRVRLARATEEERRASVNEVEILQACEHPCIVPFKEAWIEKGGVSICTVTGYCEGGDLLTMLGQLERPLPEGLLLQWFAQLGLALEYLHGNNVVHRDVKSGNVFLTDSWADGGDGGLAQLGDFGLAVHLESENGKLRDLVGTPNYMAPEILLKQPYDTKADVWALGCLLYECSTLKPAYQAFDLKGLLEKIKRGKAPAVPKNSGFSDDWRRLIRAMLHKDPDMRPTITELLDLPFVQQELEYVKGRVAGYMRKAKQRELREEITGAFSSDPRDRGMEPGQYINRGGAVKSDKPVIEVTLSAETVKEANAEVIPLSSPHAVRNVLENEGTQQESDRASVASLPIASPSSKAKASGSKKSRIHKVDTLETAEKSLEVPFHKQRVRRGIAHHSGEGEVEKIVAKSDVLLATAKERMQRMRDRADKVREARVEAIRKAQERHASFQRAQDARMKARKERAGYRMAKLRDDSAESSPHSHFAASEQNSPQGPLDWFPNPYRARNVYRKPAYEPPAARKKPSNIRRDWQESSKLKAAKAAREEAGLAPLHLPSVTKQRN